MKSHNEYRYIIALSAVLVAIFICARPCQAIQDPFDFPVDEDKLRAGELQLFQKKIPTSSGSKKRQIAGIVIIDAGPDRVWEIMKDWDELGQFIPDVDYYKTMLVLEPIGNGRIGKSFIEGRLDIPLFNIQYTLDVLFDQAHFRQEWRMMTPEEIKIYNLIGINLKPSSSGIENIEGMVLIKPYDNGNKAIYMYVSTVEYTMPLPEFLEEYIAKDALAGYMEGVKKRVESQGLYIKNSMRVFSHVEKQ